jgi:VCBS repeat-containing protein
MLIASGSIRGRSKAGGFSLLSLAALTFAAMRGARAAEPNVAILDDDRITYKDLEHGSFELVTKEAVPRHIIVDDPGETVVVRKAGSSVSVNPVGNNPTRMEELHAAQQDVLANYAKGQETNGSSAPPFSAPGLLQPINFIENDDPQAVQHALAPLPIPVVSISDIPIVRLPPPPPPPPTLNVLTGPTEVDTSVFDTFTATGGTFTASTTSGAPLSFGISGGTADATVLDGASFDISKAGRFGTLYLDSATGAYVYVPNNDAINALQAPTTESFAITVSDGTQSTVQTFTIDINGSNDAAHVSGATTGAAIEAGDTANTVRSQPTTSGTLTDTDVDNAPNTFTAVSSSTRSAGGYGTFTITADGVWTYTLDNSNPAVQALNVGGKLIDTFTVTTIDGTPQVVTITIDGTNDAAIISGTTTGSVTEPSRKDCGPEPTATGTLTDTDVDNPPNTFVAVTKPTVGTGGYGTFTMTADGVWAYTLDTDNCAVRALGEGCTLTDSFTVTTIDGTPQVVTITIHGAEHRHHHREDDSHTNPDTLTVLETPKRDATAGADDSGRIVQLRDSARSDHNKDKSETIADGHWAHCFRGNGRDDHFIYLDQGASRFDGLHDFKSKAERIDLAAFSAAAFAILALDSPGTPVAAHAIACFYDSAANETIVYANPTDHAVNIGDSDLVKLHLPGMVTVEASDFVFAPATGALVSVAALVNPNSAAGAHGMTVVAKSTADISAGAASADGARTADSKGEVHTTQVGRGCEADRDDCRTHSADKINGEANTTPGEHRSIESSLVIQPEHGLGPNQTASSDGVGTFTTGKSNAVASSYVVQNAVDTAAGLHASKQAGYEWIDSSRESWQFKFTSNDGDNGSRSTGSMTAVDGVNVPVTDVHRGMSLHGAGTFDFELSSTTHVASLFAGTPGFEGSFHFKGAAGISARSSNDGPDHDHHMTSAVIISHIVHDLIV